MKAAHRIAGSLLLLAGCPSDEDWTDEYTFMWEGKHASVFGYDRYEDEACAGSFEALDRHSAAVVDFFGYDESLRYDYYWMSHEFFQGKCPSTAGACVRAGVPHTRYVPDTHEAVHAVHYEDRGESCPLVLREGLAEYLEGPSFHDDWNDPELEGNIGELLTVTVLPYEFYERAGHFASFLVEGYGKEAVSALCAAIPFVHTVEDWDQATREVLGVELQELLDEYEQYPLCHQAQYRARLSECDGEPDLTMDLEQEEVVFEVSMHCSDPGTIGPIKGRTVATRRIGVPEEMWAKVYVLGEDGEPTLLDYNIEECAPCSTQPYVHFASTLPNIFHFPPGMYELIIYARPEEAETLTVRLVPQP